MSCIFVMSETFQTNLVQYKADVLRNEYIVGFIFSMLIVPVYHFKVLFLKFVITALAKNSNYVITRIELSSLLFFEKYLLYSSI